jgi:hypothetical protein
VAAALTGGAAVLAALALVPPQWPSVLASLTVGGAWLLPYEAVTAVLGRGEPGARQVLDPILSVLPDPTGEEPASRRTRRHREAADRLRDAHALLTWAHDGLLGKTDLFAFQSTPDGGGRLGGMADQLRSAAARAADTAGLLATALDTTVAAQRAAQHLGAGHETAALATYRPGWAPPPTTSRRRGTPSTAPPACWPTWENPTRIRWPVTLRPPNRTRPAASARRRARAPTGVATGDRQRRHRQPRPRPDGCPGRRVLRPRRRLHHPTVPGGQRPGAADGRAAGDREGGRRGRAAQGRRWLLGGVGR